jgi:hypothetical protein
MVIQSIFRPHRERNQKRIEMTDVIRCQQKSTAAICILSANHANTRDQAKHAFHQQLASVIHGRFIFAFRVCRGFVAIGKSFFQAD